MDPAKHIKTIAGKLHLHDWQVENTLRLLDDGATIPFISRYRKEVTGSLNEVQLAEIRDEYERLRELDKRREAVIKSIEEQEKMTPALLEKINATEIGAQGMGGVSTCLAVKIRTAECHIASLPVAVNLQCHAHRHIEISI